jgi:predicted permease
MQVWFLRGLRSREGTPGRVSYVTRAVVDVLRSGARMRAGPLVERESGAEGLGWDVRAAVRSMRRRPFTAAAVVLTLAVPMAVNTAVFGVVDAALLRPLPYPDADELAAVWVRQNEDGVDRARLAGPELRFLWDESRTLSALGGIWSRFGTLGGEPGPEHVDVGYVTGAFFRALGASPALGRLVAEQDDLEGARSTVVLSHPLWVRRYGADPDVIGRRVDFNGTPVTIIGVLPEDFRVLLPREARLANELDVFLPWGGGYAEMPLEWRFFAAVGRSAPGLTLNDVREELDGLATTLGGRYAGYGDAPLELVVEPLHREVTAPQRAGLLTLLASGLLLLLVACGNVSLLLLARTIRRGPEFGVRAALGAGRIRILRQVTLEHLVLFLAAGVVGVLGAPAALSLFGALVPDDIRFVHQPALDWRVLAGTFWTVVTVGLVFGALPASGARRDASSSTISTRSATARRDAVALKGALVAGEVALCVILLVGSGLLLRSFRALHDIDAGFEVEGVLTARLSLPSGEYSYGDPARISGYYEELLRRLGAAPEISDVAITEQLPLVAGSGDAEPYAWLVAEGETEWGPTRAHVRSVSGAYFETVGAELLEGRWLDPRDELDGELAVIVDDRLAARAWPGASALGQRLKVPLFLREDTEPHWARVVGVVRHVKLTPLPEPGPEQVWMHHVQSPRRSVSVVLRGTGGPEALAEPLRRVVESHDSDRPLFEVQPMAAIEDRSIAPTRFLLGLTGTFAALAVVLSALGLYALVSRTVSEARREIGIRIALGARPGDVVGGVLRWTLPYVGLGAVAGVAGATLLAGNLRSLLVGVAPRDPWTTAAAVALMGAVATLGVVVPVLRAVRTDPTEALSGD